MIVPVRRPDCAPALLDRLRNLGYMRHLVVREVVGAASAAVVVVPEIVAQLVALTLHPLIAACLILSGRAIRLRTESPWIRKVDRIPARIPVQIEPSSQPNRVDLRGWTRAGF